MAGTSSSTTSSLVESLFQSSLDDLIKALRSQPAGEPALVARSLDEIRREIRSTDPDTKATALHKLTYLSSLHFMDVSWAGFHALELLPSSSLPHKRLAYLAASISLPPSSDLLLLTTNQLRKDLQTQASLPLSFLASPAASPSLASDLATDLAPLISSSKPSVRAKATAVAFRVFSLSPDSLRICFKRVVDNLEASQDPGVVSAAVGVFCELSNADPRPYLPLAPEFYRILVDSKNNWVLIKVLKIFARLAPLEPRLVPRIVGPICDHLRRSNAKSLVFECIRTVAAGLADYGEVVRLAVDKVKEFLASDNDPNLRYLGLTALSMLGPRHSWAVEESREVVIKTLSDPDPSIRREALHLIVGMVFESNLMDISVLLVNYALKSDPKFSNEILEALLSTCGRNVYELVVDFDWYVSLLGEMARSPHCAKGEEIERQLVDIGLRVKDARLELVRVARDLLIDPALLGNPLLYRILSAAAWLSGEYVEFSRNPSELLEALLQPRTSLLPTLVRAVYIQAVFKVVTYCFNSYIEQREGFQLSAPGNAISKTDPQEEPDAVKHEIAANTDSETSDEPNASFDTIEKRVSIGHESIVYMLNLIETAIAPLVGNHEVEIQERARNVLGFVHLLQETGLRSTIEEGTCSQDQRIDNFVKLTQYIFSDELGPVSANAQERVSVPDGLILKENLADLAAVLGEEDMANVSPLPTFSLQSRHQSEKREESNPSVESTSLLTEHRKRHGLYYLAAEEEDAEARDYPRANEPPLSLDHDDTTEDLAKLTDQSLIPRKSKQTKPRPLVVILDDGDDVKSSAAKLEKNVKRHDLLSDAVMDILLPKEDKASSSQKRMSERSSRSRAKDMPFTIESTSLSGENLNLGDMEVGSSRSRSGHQNHSKTKHRRSLQSEDKEEKGHRSSSRSRHHHGRHKNKQHGDPSLQVVPQAPVIQDFLL